MSTVSAPFGLRAVYKSGGTPSSLSMQAPITSGYATAIGEGDAVKLVGGVLTRAAATGDSAVGIFMGVEYTDANGRRQESNQWIASLTGTNIVAYYTMDPYITYEIQSNATVAFTAIGTQYDLVSPGPANTTVGISGAMLDISTATQAANKLLRIVGLTPGADNAFGDNFPIVQVQFSKHQNVAIINAYA
jgi:hypothetical protein